MNIVKTTNVIIVWYGTVGFIVPVDTWSFSGQFYGPDDSVIALMDNG